MYDGHWQIFDGDGRRKYATDDERRLFLHAITALSCEQRVFCLVLVYSGARISEVLGLTAMQVEPGIIRFRTLKRRKLHYRSVPMPEALTAELMALLAQRPGAVRFWEVQRSTAWRWVKRGFQLAGITGAHASPKGLRHAFGVRAAARMPLPVVRVLMGHARLETTAIYVDAVGAELRAFAATTWCA